MEFLEKEVVEYIESENKGYEILNEAKKEFFSDILCLNEMIRSCFNDKIKKIQNEGNERRNEEKSLNKYIFDHYYKVERVLTSIDSIKKKLNLDDMIEDINKLEMQLNYVKKMLKEVKEMDQ
ncbi:hypothetical protein T552_03496 [Pneumocystis carinii B80]|uniref:Biogenesis of lysosome-related organelles complex 1 subunit BLI1 n=1 Tax=Pneumocystis carinii (strain B80) TaxID=1408658 RepID=A0A0W4ZB01_PNEC8|nr:hypothetical protein T552_03496 [Pneumocystis carinii B80]KTW25636.1 hypothetical protein T552_03496 [Pneumocystis carinii B80]